MDAVRCHDGQQIRALLEPAQEHLWAVFQRRRSHAQLEQVSVSVFRLPAPTRPGSIEVSSAGGRRTCSAHGHDAYLAATKEDFGSGGSTRRTVSLEG